MPPRGGESTTESIFELDTAAKESVPWINSKSERLIKHLKECRHIDTTVQAEYKEDLPSPKRQKVIQTTLQVTAKTKWTQEMVHTLNKDIVRFIASTSSAFNIVTDPMFRHLFRTYAGNPPLASRQTLSRRYLKELVEEIEEDARKRMEGKLGMGQCDGWKNVGRTSVIASLVTVEQRSHVLHVHNVSAEKKTADNLLQLVLNDILHLHNRGVIVVGWVSDAGGDSRAMRLRLAQHMPQLIVLDCWAHQINLIVGDYFKLDNDYVDTVELAMDVVKWFNNHSYALGLLRVEQKTRNGKILALFLAVLTRWTSHYLSLSRLLQLRLPLQTCVLNQREELLRAAGKKPEQVEEADRILDIVENGTFWRNLELVCKHLRPLAIAANATQGTRGALYSVALTLANLYRTYRFDRTINEEVKNCLLHSIDKRWAKTDQDSFILAVILNPYIRLQLFKTGSFYSTTASVYGLVIRLWKRYFTMDYDGELFDTVVDYCNGRNEFSDTAMYLRERQEHIPEGSNVDILQLWNIKDDNSYKGRNQLIKLAIRVHSAIANSADCERFFSKMGDIHTKKRNRLNEQTVRDLAVVKMALDEESKVARQRQAKRKRNDNDDITRPQRSSHTPVQPTPFSHNSVSSSSSRTSTEPNTSVTQDTDDGNAEIDGDGGISIRELVGSLTTAAAQDDAVDDDPLIESNPPDPILLEKVGGIAEPTAPTMCGPIRLYFGTYRTNSLADLFDFSSSKVEIWEQLWNHGEVELYKEELGLETNDAVEGSNEVTERPIVVE